VARSLGNAALSMKPSTGARTLNDSTQLTRTFLKSGRRSRSYPEVVCDVFRGYLRLGCVKKLKDHLERNQIRSKSRTSSAGRTSGGKTFSGGASTTCSTIAFTLARSSTKSSLIRGSKIYQVQPKRDDQDRRCREAVSALQTAAPAERAAIQEAVTQRQAQFLEAEIELKTLKDEFNALSQKVSDQEAYVSRFELLNFLLSRRRAVNPRNLANALAGLPTMAKQVHLAERIV
jgi:hypothetical protein